MNLRRGLRIGFTGAGGTGKTTTAKYISEKLNLPTFPSASRQVYEAEGLTEDKVLAMSGEERLELQTRIFAKKLELDQAHEFVTDRTILDHFAYCLAYCAPYMTNELFNKYEAMTRTHLLGAYTHIFYFPWGVWQAEGDGVRQDLQSWQSQIDALIVGYLARWVPNIHVVPQDTGADSRNMFVLTKLVS
jgi:hypothetical protein